MHVGRRTLFYEEHTPAYIGVGNTSLLRFLAATVPVGNPILSERALLTAVYLVNQAKDFVDGCSGQTRAALIRDHGFPDWRGGDGAPSLDTFISAAEQMQKSVKNVYGVLVDPDAEMNTLEEAIKEARKCVRDRYRSL